TVKAQDEAIAQIAEDKLTALETGTTVLLFTTCNGYSGRMTLNVVESAELAQNGFVWSSASLSMITGLKQKPEIRLNAEGVRRGYTLEIENPEGKTVLVLDEAGELNAVETGTAVLRMMLNADETQQKTLAASANITVYTYQDVQMNIPAEKNMAVGEIADFDFAITYPENLICDIPLTYTLSNDYVQFMPMVTVLSPDNDYAGTGIITAGEIKGTSTDLTFFENPNLTCVIRMPQAKYRALIISEYDQNTAGNSLPFAQNNVNSLQKTLALSSVEGERYDTMMLKNPSKGSIATAIGSHFKDAKPGDVSVIYIVSHGHSEATTSNGKCYNFGVTDGSRIYTKSDPSTYVTSYELLNYMSGIQGNVILLLDSCCSGQFIIDTSDQMAMMGNISVMTAQVADVRASWFNGASNATTIEFFTYALCYGLGFEMLETTLSSMPADNNPTNSAVTIDELFHYAITKTISTINQKRADYPGKVVVGGGSQPESGWYQSPQIYIGLGLEDTILSARN
ncbi:MAG: caspase family protein, partial [Clostridia bacterium]|nr:caspase family protein [Clostridia bacterium]